MRKVQCPIVFVVGTQPCKHLHHIFETDVFPTQHVVAVVEKVNYKKQK